MATGAGAYVKYGWESTFKTAVSATNLFGVGTKMDRDENNNMLKIYSLGQRPASNVVPTAFTGRAGMDFVLSNPWFLRGIFGNTPTTASMSSPYTWKFVDTANSIPVANKVPSMTIENAIKIDGPDPISELKGAVCDSLTLTIASNDAVRCRLDILFADVDYTQGTYDTSATVLDTFDPFIYSHGHLELPSGSALADVTNATITIRNNTQMITGIGARGSSNYVVRNLDVEIRATILLNSTGLLEALYGQNSNFTGLPLTPTDTTLKLYLDNGLSTTNQRRIEMDFGHAWVNQDTIRQAVEETMMQTVTIVTAQPTYVAAINASSSAS